MSERMRVRKWTPHSQVWPAQWGGASQSDASLRAADRRAVRQVQTACWTFLAVILAYLAGMTVGIRLESAEAHQRGYQQALQDINPLRLADVDAIRQQAQREERQAASSRVIKALPWEVK